MSRTLGLVALASLVTLGATPDRAAPLGDVALVQRRSLDAARAIGRLYQATNDGAYEAYVVRALTAHAEIGRSERCRLPSGAVSRRPTVIANPPLARTSIAQREHLMSAIGTYEATLVAIAERAGTAGIAVATGDFQRELADLGAAANAHAQGDLFIEDATKALTGEAERLVRADDAAAQLRAIDALEPIIRKLVGILAYDAARQRADSLDAAALAYRGWSSYDRQTAAASGAPASTGPTASTAKEVDRDLPACSEPAIYTRAARRGGEARNADDVRAALDSHDATVASDATQTRTARARRRLDAVRAASPAALLSALSELDDNELRVLKSPEDAPAAAAAKSALLRFDAVASEFAARFDSR